MLATRSRKIRRIANLAGYAILLATACLALFEAATALPPADSPSASPEQRRQIAQSLALRERSWRLRARQKFPEDYWSQDDDFHNIEQYTVRSTARAAGVRLSDVIYAIDELLREAPALRRTTASPCKPRPFYD